MAHAGRPPFAVRVLPAQFRQLPACPRVLSGTQVEAQSRASRGLAQEGGHLKTKAVPSDPPRSLLPSRHARPERGFGPPVRFFRCSPPWLLAAADQRSGRRTALRSRRSRRLGAAFPSPAAGALFGASSPGSSFLACPFGALQLGARTRSVLGSPPRGACAARGRSAPKTRCPNPQAVIPLPPRALLPLGISQSLRLVARLDSASGSSPVQPWYPSSLPGSACLAEGLSGSSLRGSHAASSSLFRGPLGTKTILQRLTPRCQVPCGQKARSFSEIYHLFFQMVTDVFLLKFSA